MVVIREIEMVDLEKAKKLLAQSLALQQPPESPQVDPADIFQRLKAQKLPKRFEGHISYLVAEDEEKLVGICVFYTYSDGLAYYADIRDLFVLPGYRWQGIGSALLNQAKSASRALGCMILICLPPSDNTEVNYFLEKNGFQKGEHLPYIAALNSGG